MSYKRIAIIGSRSLAKASKEVQCQAIDFVQQFVTTHKPEWIVSGNAAGADQLSHLFENNLQYIPWANFNSHLMINGNSVVAGEIKIFDKEILDMFPWMETKFYSPLMKMIRRNFAMIKGIKPGNQVDAILYWTESVQVTGGTKYAYDLGKKLGIPMFPINNQNPTTNEQSGKEVTKVVNLHRDKYDVYIGRGSKWGNPFVMQNNSDQERNRVIDLYHNYLFESGLINDISELRGKTLGCYCKPKRCHGDILAYYADNKIIDRFVGEYKFLSNFYSSEVMLDAVVYPNVENAYQASKTTNEEMRIPFENISPVDAKRMGKTLKMRPDFDTIKVNIMYRLVKQKFQDPELAKRLASTKESLLVEGNTWGDTFWGICNGVGENHLGKILMKVRKELK